MKAMRNYLVTIALFASLGASALGESDGEDA